MPLSVAHLSELEVPPADLIEYAARAGFASIGLRINPAQPGGIAYPLATKAERAEVRRRIAATGVSVLYIEMVGLSETTRIADYRAMLETGAEIGASRVAVGGDSANFQVVAERMAEMCDLARPHGIAVDIEFMPFRPVRTFADAVEVVRRADRPNAHILVDALHVFRSGSSLDDIAKADPAFLGTFQICDAPREAPPPAELAMEARTRRMLPGHGNLPLWPLIDALPADMPVGVELPVAGQFPHLDAPARLELMMRSTRLFYASRRQ
ncbi:MAG TPA: sugar phosphate isomerase/epimerase [Hyphomicrobiaceae bacterium]|nr:sugar phosphate isomerase/epimerase [Hyphomicrobiaceae bacterium]